MNLPSDLNRATYTQINKYMTEISRKKPWLVLMHHRMRTVSFAMMFGAIALHIEDKSYSLVSWLLFILVFLIYPHVQYVRACKAENAVDAEMKSLLVDSLLLGLAVAAVEFPLWITVSAMLGTLTNNSANKGWRGVSETVIALLVGALIGIIFFGFKFSPHTDWPTTLFCITGITGYLLAVNNFGFTRNVQLRLAREDLQHNEKELLAINETLLKNLREIDELQKKLTRQANRDTLTNLYNRHYLDTTLGRELARCKRGGKPLALIMIDIDNFKHINDTYGHQAGDAVLIQFGALLIGMARSEDVACRYGGEEFLLLMPIMSLEKARERAEELRAAFGNMIVTFGDLRLQATISIGISAYPGNASSADELIKCADNALYIAKNAGRNRVEISNDNSKQD